MARGKDLAGLAALGALGYMMTRGDKSKESKTDTGDETARLINRGGPRRKIEDYAAKAPAGTAPSVTVDKTVKSAAAPRVQPAAESSGDEDYSNEGRRQGTERQPLYMTKTPGGDEKRVEGNKPMPSLKAVESRAAARKASTDTDAMRNASRAAAAQMRRSKLSPVDQIPGQSRRAPEGGERIDSTELGRNVSNTMNALAPYGSGVGKIGAELATGNRVQRAYNAAQAERRAAEGMSPAEALLARQEAAQAARDAKVLNPNAWLAGPKGMAENFRKGGAVKKMASGGMTASRRGDGIASRGKTKCKMY